MGNTAKKDAQVHVRLTAAERDDLLRLASQLDISPSELVRRSFTPYAVDLLNRRRRRTHREALACLS